MVHDGGRIAAKTNQSGRNETVRGIRKFGAPSFSGSGQSISRPRFGGLGNWDGQLVCCSSCKAPVSFGEQRRAAEIFGGTGAERTGTGGAQLQRKSAASGRRRTARQGGFGHGSSRGDAWRR